MLPDEWRPCQEGMIPSRSPPAPVPFLPVVTAIAIKMISVMLFAVMSTLVRYLGDAAAVGQVVFFRSAFAIVPGVVIYAWRRELAAALRTGRWLGHVARGLISLV